MNDEIHDQILQDSQEEVYHPRQRKEEVRVDHKTQVGEIVYSFLRHRYCPQLYMKANEFFSAMHMAGYAWWVAEYKLKALLNWANMKGVHPLGVVKVLNREIKKLKLYENSL